MGRYLYERTGLYKDFLKMKKGNNIVHDGGVPSLIGNKDNRLEFRMNYGKNYSHPCELKKINNYIITTPLKEYMINDEYLYYPLVFTRKEYKELIDNTYVPRRIAKNMRELNKDDIVNMLIMQFSGQIDPSEIVGIEVLGIEDILDHIIAFSEQDEKFQKCINKFKESHPINIKK